MNVEKDMSQQVPLSLEPEAGGRKSGGGGPGGTRDGSWRRDGGWWEQKETWGGYA